ncbi:BA14K family protein [Sinorhizobium psoraleae]|uniref:Lectin-like protein BA14k n=1 Tax=Sinorhizobium psoraleae TaxID=520838 RepID=A0ABT4KKM7_9HYPH|nr:BA14K family protein [Sinorhizobium psoraleae]MCZ4092526.1 BA14K family protein [Sinorhizobium psoraleae]
MKRLAIIALSLATALTSVPPAMAFPTIVVPKIDVQEAEPVQYRRYRGGYNRGYRGYRRGGYYRHRDDDDDELGWALGGLAAGAILGGLLAQPRPYYDYGPTYYTPRYYAPPPRYYAAPRYYRPAYGGNAHTRWCFARYRSYRAYDNTFQPYYGPRQPCVSPYY